MTRGQGVPGKQFSRADLVHWTPFSDFVVRQLTDQLVEWDHLIIEDGGMGGKPYKYKLGKPLPEIQSLLPTPEELETRIENSRRARSSASKGDTRQKSAEEPSQEQADDSETDSPSEESAEEADDKTTDSPNEE